MAALRFRAEAEADLRAIVEWYEGLAPEALENILADIERGLRLLELYPRAGPVVSGRSFRRIVTRAYRFKIAYNVEEEFVTVLGIFRYQNRET